MVDLLAPVPDRPVEPLSGRPSLSVVVAAWKAAGTIRRSVGSALAQTLPPLEVVVCDDGSPDADVLAQELQPFEERVRLVHVDHGGEARAKNAAVHAARGEVVVVLDADDRWEPGRLEALADAICLRPDLVLVTTDAIVRREGVEDSRYYDLNAFPTSDQDVAILQRSFVFGHVAAWRQSWIDAGGMDERLPVGADWDFFLRLVLEGGRVGLVPHPLATYDVTPTSLSGPRARSLAARVQLLDKAALEHTLTPDQEKARRRARNEFARRAARQSVVDAVREGRGARRALARCAAVPGTPVLTRTKYVAAAGLPWLARRQIDSQ